ncbi:hypothetical protein IQ260_21540 [Leptolyngbya cf. ectocarpi LEGE 11479]|uniref:Uncharacterized protein n=1 Tax=Leptolyngbya cf. ectocarpi LEGE 11479 TaxID=1828722 RepID=A0A929FBL4_LEPEC|nr:hypothetical protein [Leptolyngbya ectocarpi]MBE9069232.1 hypothetical protein [Leptolyngbya cf. ectocarpi LEGE 11479]
MIFPRIYSEQHYAAAVTAAVADLLQSYRGYQIDVMRQLPSLERDTRAYELWITAWDRNEDRYEFIYELQIGVVKGELIILSWIPL